MPKRNFTVIQLCTAIVIVGLIFGAVAGVFRVVARVREAARSTQCHGRRFQLYTALIQYNEIHGSLPPPVTLGPDGRPWHSWRVLLLELLDHDTYSQYRFDEPWDGPNNRKLGQRLIDHYQCPSSPDAHSTTNTNFVVVVGRETYFPSQGRAFDLEDERQKGAASPIMIIEVIDSDIHWMEPRDMALDDLFPKNKTQIGTVHPKGIGVVLGSGKYTYLPADISASTLRERLRVPRAE